MTHPVRGATTVPERVTGLANDACADGEPVATTRSAKPQIEMRVSVSARVAIAARADMAHDRPLRRSKRLSKEGC